MTSPDQSSSASQPGSEKPDSGTVGTTRRRRGPFALLLLTAKGALMGVANTIPGVSGGTIAVILRIYDELIAAISTFFTSGWKRNVAILIPILLGTGIGIMAAARILDVFLERYPVQTAFFFAGLILGSLPLLFRIALQRSFRPGHVLPLIGGLALILGIAFSGRPPLSDPITSLTLSAAPWIFITGVISAATMVIPGVSGSFVLLLIGMYATFINAVNNFTIPILLVAGAGAVVGIVLVSKLIHLLLARAHAVTYWAIIGLVAGSVVSIWIEAGVGFPDPASMGTLAAGTVTAFLLGGRPAQEPEISG